MTDFERRVVGTEFSLRSAGENKKVIEGYAYRFHQRSQNLGGFVEQVLPGAGAESVASDDIRALFNHDRSLILGRSASGTLRLGEDSDGLSYEIDIDERQSYVRDLIIAMERGDVTQSSFAFRTSDEDWGWTEDDFPLRSLRKMSVLDVSPVTVPAYTSATSGVSARALEHAAELKSPAAPSLWIPSYPALPAGSWFKG